MVLKTIRVSALVALATFTVANNGQAREFAEIYTECGLGAMIAPRTEAVAAVTNVTWDLGTTAVSSNISSPDTCQGGKEKTAAFINQSYDSLENDLARGNGAYLDALVEMSGCPEVSQADLRLSLRKDFANLVGAPEYGAKSRYEKAEVLYNLLYVRMASLGSNS